MQIKISLPQELYEKVKEECKKSYRTLSGEIAFRVGTTFETSLPDSQAGAQTQITNESKPPKRREGDFLW